MGRKNLNDILDILPVILTVIIGTFVFAIASHLVIEERFPDKLLDLWNTWDVQHYIKIAKYGYGALTVDGKNLQIVFFPLFPFLTKLFSYIFQNYIVSALVVSNLAYAAAAYYLYKLVKLDFEKEDAYRAVIYFSVFPTAYFLHAAYTESLFLALTISSFYYARNDRWALASVLGMLAAATRITGILLIPVLIIEYLSQKDYKIRNIRLDIIWIGVIGFGLLAYLIVNYVVAGDPLYFLDIQSENWNKKLAIPYEGFKNAWNTMTGELALNVDSPANKMLGGTIEIISAFMGLALIIYSFFRLRLSYCLYALATWIIITSTGFWLSIPRYTLAMFPIFIAMALLGRKKYVNYLIIFISILFYALFLSSFVRFRWAF
jgi:Dolichyl-phosphate-mannose-protein mannosyltransferase